MSNWVETLEGRTLFSSAWFSHGVLHVHGAPHAQNTIDVEMSTDGQSVIVSVLSPDAKHATSLQKAFNSAGITAVDILGGQKADTISIGAARAFNIKTHIRALGGDDTITTSAEDDVIAAGKGNDVVSSGDGSDTVAGGRGDDRITVGDGNDTVYAGKGNDTVLAGNGNDALWGGRGDDSITAGNGDDTFGGILGRNTLIGGTGHNRFLVRDITLNDTNYDPAKDVIVTVGKKETDAKGSLGN